MSALKPIKFKEVNKILHKPENMTDEECNSLPVFNDGNQVISCWKMSWKHRLYALFYGKVWLCVLGGSTQPPVWIDCDKTVFLKNQN